MIMLGDIGKLDLSFCYFVLLFGIQGCYPLQEVKQLPIWRHFLWLYASIVKSHSVLKNWIKVVIKFSISIWKLHYSKLQCLRVQNAQRSLFQEVRTDKCRNRSQGGEQEMKQKKYLLDTKHGQTMTINYKEDYMG